MALASWVTENSGPGEVEHRYVPVDGHPMHYWKAGAGPSLVLLHGLLGTAAAWEPMAPRFAKDSTVYAIDALGVGGSERAPTIDPGLEAQAARVAAFMRRLGIESADVLGTSHGGAVAMMLAASHPQRVRSLILHAPVNPYSHLGDTLVRFYRFPVGRWLAHRIPELPNSLKAVALGRMYGDAMRIRPGSLETYVDSLRVPGTIDYVLRLLSGWFEDMRSLESALGRVRTFPTLLIWGCRDRAVSLESGRKLARCFDHAQLVLLPDAGHLPYDECPERFSEAVGSFLCRERSVCERGFKLVGQKPRLCA